MLHGQDRHRPSSPAEESKGRPYHVFHLIDNPNKIGEKRGEALRYIESTMVEPKIARAAEDERFLWKKLIHLNF